KSAARVLPSMRWSSSIGLPLCLLPSAVADEHDSSGAEECECETGRSADPGVPPIEASAVDGDHDRGRDRLLPGEVARTNLNRISRMVAQTPGIGIRVARPGDGVVGCCCRRG